MVKNRSISLKINNFLYQFKVLNRIYLIILLFFPLITSSQTKEKAKYSHKAVSLQKKAVKFQFSITGTEKEIYTKMLKMLDSATEIEPTYALAYRTKIIPLIHLKKYNQALLILYKVRKIDPTNLKDIIKQGIIYEVFLKKPTEATIFYKQAYEIALKKKNTTITKNSFPDQAIAYCLMFYKGKEAAVNYLSRCSKNYNDKKSMDQIKQLQTLIRSSKLGLSEKKDMLNSNT